MSLNAIFSRAPQATSSARNPMARPGHWPQPSTDTRSVKGGSGPMVFPTAGGPTGGTSPVYSPKSDPVTYPKPATTSKAANITGTFGSEGSGAPQTNAGYPSLDVAA